MPRLCCSGANQRLPDHSLTLDEAWPVHSAGGWPEDLSLRREDIYAERI